MRTAGLPNFQKLWGIIPSPIEAGTYNILIKNNINASVYRSKKSLILTTTSLGGNNDFLGWMLLSVGVVNVVSIILTIYHVRNKSDSK